MAWNGTYEYKLISTDDRSAKINDGRETRRSIYDGAWAEGNNRISRVPVRVCLINREYIIALDVPRSISFGVR